MRDTFEKRRKEQRRKEKQNRKAERREQRKSIAPVSPYSQEAIARPEPDPFDTPPPPPGSDS